MPAFLLPIAGIALGAGAMFLFDPQQGRRRRALARDRIASKTKQARHFADVAARDISYRARGVAAEVRALRRRGEVTDDLLVDRVRAKLGRYVSHPRAIVIEADRGCVILSGPVLAVEHGPLVQAARAVRGVEAVEDRLEVHESGDNIPALQGGSPRRMGERSYGNWSPAGRVLFGGAGSALMFYSILRRSPLGVVAFIAGAAMLLRAATNEPLQQVARKPLLRIRDQMQSQKTQEAGPPTFEPATTGSGALWPEV